MSVRYLGTNSPDGTCLGYDSAEKISFYGTTPAVQPSAIDDATDAGTVITQCNAVIAALETLGLIAS